MHKGLTPAAPTQAALETLVHHSQLLQLQHPQQDWSHQTQEVSHCREDENPKAVP